MHFEHLIKKKCAPLRLHVAAVLVKIEVRPFAAGAMRECYAMKKLLLLLLMVVGLFGGVCGGLCCFLTGATP